MDKEVTIQFDEEAYREYKELQEVVIKGKAAKGKPTYSQLLSSINNAIRNIKANPYYGDLIPRKYISKGVINKYGTDKILLFGGLRGLNPILNDTWVYDLSENKWTNKTPNNHPGARYEHAMASIWGTDKVVLMGGRNDGNVFYDTWIYDLSNNTWTSFTPNSPTITAGFNKLVISSTIILAVVCISIIYKKKNRR